MPGELTRASGDSGPLWIGCWILQPGSSVPVSQQIVRYHVFNCVFLRCDPQSECRELNRFMLSVCIIVGTSVWRSEDNLGCWSQPLTL